ncbi:MAG: hypothetical protein ACHP7O_13335, partial [Burkholderiales bacterium]
IAARGPKCASREKFHETMQTHQAQSPARPRRVWGKPLKLRPVVSGPRIEAGAFGAMLGNSMMQQSQQTGGPTPPAGSTGNPYVDSNGNQIVFGAPVKSGVSDNVFNQFAGVQGGGTAAPSSLPVFGSQLAENTFGLTTMTSGNSGGVTTSSALTPDQLALGGVPLTPEAATAVVHFADGTPR